MSRKKLASLEVANSKMFVFPVLSFIDSLAQRHTAMDVTRYQQLRFVASEIFGLSLRAKEIVDGEHPIFSAIS